MCLTSTSAPASVSQISKSLEVGKLSADVEVRHIRSAHWENIGAFLARMRSPTPHAAWPIAAVAATSSGSRRYAPPISPLAHVPEVVGVDASPPSVRRPPLGGLLDFAFTTFFTTKIVGVLFGAVLLLASGALLTGVIFGLTTITSASAASKSDPSSVAILLGVAAMAAGLVGAISIVVLGRVVLELIVVTFRISETLTELKTKLR
jgi:hypothetical protein